MVEVLFITKEFLKTLQFLLIALLLNVNRGAMYLKVFLAFVTFIKAFHVLVSSP